MKYAKDEGVEAVSITQIDLTGRWKNMTLPVDQLNDDLFDNGLGISLGSYPGYASFEASDGKAVPDPTTAYIDVFPKMKTLRMLTDIKNADGTDFDRDPRAIARQAEAYLAGMGIGQSVWAPELEFFLFDEVRYISEMNRASFFVDNSEAVWNGEREENPSLGHKISVMKGSQLLPPRDQGNDIRDLMVKRIRELDIPIRYHHHEGGAAGQMEVEVLFQPLLRSADSIMMAKHVIKNTALEHNKSATFMPKPVYGDAGSGLHFHLYLTDGQKSLFWDENGYSCLAEVALQFTAGLLEHASALMAFTNPTTNSYIRFAPGLAAPTTRSFSVSNRTSAVRIPGYSINPRENRIEYRIPDAACNPYLVLAGMLMAGLDGVNKKMDPTKMGYGPFDMNLWDLTDEQKTTIKHVPDSLEGALEALEKDHDFLLAGNVFDRNFIKGWIDLKLEEDVYPMKRRPHPYEYTLYYDI